ncbi:MAG: hypothetical protein NTY04_03355 [Candidatus Staskawiczbacteria bacterium]|nr:hypothetical protein [Candidatus Staskawiczbacteria bacterium]
MILFVHMLFGAATGSLIKNVPLAIILAFLGHYFLDFLPHIEYNIENIEKKQWRTAMPTIFKILLDFCLGILLILIFSKNHPIIYICAIVSIVPDSFTVLSWFMPIKILEAHNKLNEKIHLFKYKKISNFWRFSSQIVIIIISIILLKL